LQAIGSLGLSAAGLGLLEACSSQLPAPSRGEETLETTTIRLVQIPGICQAAQYVAEEFLRGEGFTEVQYLKKPGAKGIELALASGEADINMHFVAPTLIRVEAGDPVVMLMGAHVGCFELFGTDRIRTIHDLKGKTVGVLELGSSQHVFIASMVAYVGLDPRQDINWLTLPATEAESLLAEGKIDAYLAFPPGAQELHAKKIGHVVVNSTMDKPWSQYFCCMATGRREFVQQNPTATKRALRAILKATDLCAREPERAARFMVDKGYTDNYDYALDAMKMIPYNKWAEYDPEDTLRFYALQLRDAGLIKSNPDEIIAQGADWRILNELKMELKEQA
jgi:NitT/TauT family transport system substrate-binding protein